MWVIGDPPRPISISHGRNAMESPEPPSLSVDMPHAIFMTGQGGGKGGALKEREGGECGRQTDGFPRGQMHKRRTNSPSIPHSHRPKCRKSHPSFSQWQRIVVCRGHFLPVDAQKMNFGADIILMSQAKRVSSSKPHHSGMDGWLHPSVLPSHSQTYPRLIADVMN